MNNIIKMLSANKDFRMVIADTHQISEKALSEFTGTSLYTQVFGADHYKLYAIICHK